MHMLIESRPKLKESILLVNSLLDDGYSIDDVLLSLVNNNYWYNFYNSDLSCNLRWS